MTSPRVLVLTPDFPPAFGGIQLLIHRVVSNLQSFEPRVITLDVAGAREWDRGQALDVHRVPIGPDRRFAILRLNARAVTEAARFRPQVVLAAHIVAGPGASACRRLFRVPSAVYLHAKEVGASPRVASFAVHNCDAVIAVSRYTERLAAGVGADPAKVHRIPPGVDLPAPDDPTPPDTADGRPTFVTIARLEDRYKGHDVITRALPLIRARVPDVEWVVIGEGALRRDIERLARVHGVEGSIRLVGSVSDAERDRWLSRASLLAMPSRLPAGNAAGEGFGIVFLEAGTHRLPAVAGNVGGALDSVVHGSTGLLVDPTNHVAVAGAISDLLLDKPRARAMGEAGFRHAHAHAWPLIATKVEQLLTTLARDGVCR